MNAMLERIRAVGLRAWLLFVQWLNWIAVSLFGSALIVNQTYPGVIANAVGKLPPLIGIPLIFAFGALVHYALRRAKKAGE